MDWKGFLIWPLDSNAANLSHWSDKVCKKKKGKKKKEKKKDRLAMNSLIKLLITLKG